MILVKKSNKSKFEQGLTLIEASMVLALSAVVIAGAVMYYNSASESNKAQRAQSLIGAVQAGVQSLYATRPNYLGLDTNALASTSSIPRAFMETSTNSIIHPWGGTIEVAAVGTTGRNYNLTFRGVPRTACGALASSDLGNALVGVAVATGNVTAPTTVGVNNPSAPNFSKTVQDLCTGAVGQQSDALTTVTWTFQ